MSDLFFFSSNLEQPLHFLEHLASNPIKEQFSLKEILHNEEDNSNSDEKEISKSSLKKFVNLKSFSDFQIKAVLAIKEISDNPRMKEPFNLLANFSESKEEPISQKITSRFPQRSAKICSNCCHKDTKCLRIPMRKGLSLICRGCATAYRSGRFCLYCEFIFKASDKSWISEIFECQICLKKVHKRCENDISVGYVTETSYTCPHCLSS